MKALTPIAVCAALVMGGCGSSSDSSLSSTGATAATATVGPPPKVVVPNGAPPKTLVVTDLKKGTGAEAKHGDELTVQFAAVRYVTGQKFESSWDPGSKPFTFHLDHEDVSPGWVKGIPGMKVGGRRRLIVPPKMTSRYGVPPGTGPEATLVYVIDLLEVH